MSARKSQLISVIVVAAITAGVMFTMNSLKPVTAVESIRDRVEKIEAISARRQNVIPIVHAQAVVESKLNISLKSQLSGQISYTSPKFLSGGFFDSGELILRLDASDYELELVQAQVDVARAQQELRTEEELGELARIDWGKYSDKKASNLVLRLPQLRQAQTALRGAKANYDLKKLQLSRTEIKAPFPLMIGEKQVDLGQVVAVNQDLAVVFGTSEAEIRIPLSQQQIDLLSISKVGLLAGPDVLSVNVRDPSRKDTLFWSATIFRIEGSIDRKSRVYYAVATVFDPLNIADSSKKPPLLPGAFVDVEISGPTIEQVFRVPARAMHDDNNIFIYSEQKLTTKAVVVLDRDKDFVTIVSGLEEGDKISVSPPWSYVPGMKAKLASLDGKPTNEPPKAVTGDTTKRPSREEIAKMTPEQRAAMRERLRNREGLQGDSGNKQKSKPHTQQIQSHTTGES